MWIAAQQNAREAQLLLLLNAEVGENFRFGFISGQQIVADGAVLRNGGTVLSRMAAVVAAEASRIFHVANVVGMCSPGDFHERKYILVIERYQLFAGLVDKS